jgi:hypothetical protein
MTATACTFAPPYHVQTTAIELRNGFPYFTHHDSISALWGRNGVRHVSMASTHSPTVM